jgi:hypothetical protein
MLVTRVAIALLALARRAPLAAEAQQAAKIHPIGLLCRGLARTSWRSRGDTRAALPGDLPDWGWLRRSRRSA